MSRNVIFIESQRVDFERKMVQRKNHDDIWPDGQSRAHDSADFQAQVSVSGTDSPSGNAVRVARHRHRKAQRGIKQVNLMVPVAAHAPLKALARRLRNGEALEAAMFEVLSGLEQTGTARLPGFTKTEVVEQEVETFLDLSLDPTTEEEPAEAPAPKRKFRFFR